MSAPGGGVRDCDLTRQAGLQGYTYWHRDSARPDAWPYPQNRIIKMFLYLSDVESDGGPLGLSPKLKTLSLRAITIPSSL